MKQYICIDIGGTSIKYGIIQEDAAFLVTGEMRQRLCSMADREL